jgi:hypothetical protein
MPEDQAEYWMAEATAPQRCEALEDAFAIMNLNQ